MENEASKCTYDKDNFILLSELLFVISILDPKGVRWRIVFAILGATGMAVSYALKVNLSIAIVSMVDQTSSKVETSSGSLDCAAPNLNQSVEIEDKHTNTSLVELMYYCHIIDTFNGQNFRYPTLSIGQCRSKAWCWHPIFGATLCPRFQVDGYLTSLEENGSSLLRLWPTLCPQF